MDQVRIKVLAPFAGYPRWDETLPIEGEIDLKNLFLKIGNELGKALITEVLDKAQPPYMLFVNGTKVRSGEFENITLRGGDEVVVFALLIGG
jgi:hypothetical protein